MRDELIREIEVEMELFRREAQQEFKSFIAWTMHTYKFNWHHLYLINKLEAFQRGEIRRLMVFMPPRHGKSQLVSRHLPAWIFGHNPDASVIACSYSAALASSMNRDVQKIMTSPKYYDLFPDAYLVKNTRGARRTSTTFDIPERMGKYICAGVGGSITGEGADYGIIDDPVKNQEEAESKTYRDRLWDWYVSTFYTRLEKDASILLTLTRWHEDDLAGRLLKQMEEDSDLADQWEIVSFPAIKEDNANPDDVREIGEALWPEKYDEMRMASIKKILGDRYWNALYRQNPVKVGGNIIKGEWFKRYRKSEFNPPVINFYLDTAFTSNTQNDATAILAHFIHNDSLYIWESRTMHLSFVDLVAYLIEYVNSFGSRAGYLKIEPKASGLDVIDYLERYTTINVIEDEAPTSDKVARVHASTPYMQSGRVLIPEDEDWVSDYLQELEAFPAGKRDDQVDCTTGAIRDALHDEEIWGVALPRGHY